MLHELGADDSQFKTVRFQPGLNLLVAQKTHTSRATDSRNGSGKSSMVELLHFLLGARSDNRGLFARKELRATTFTLDLDWPRSGRVRVSRSGRAAKEISLTPPILGAPFAGVTDDSELVSIFDIDEFGSVAQRAESERRRRTETISLDEWQRAIERDLFGLPDQHPGVSGRILLGFLLRRVSDHGFNEAVRSFSRQSEAQASPNIAYLLGLDSRLAARYQELAAKRAARDQLKKAMNDPVWGRVVGNRADLRGELSIQRRKIEELRRQLESFRVVPQYEALKERADEITRRIQDLGSADTIDQRNLDHLERAVAESVDPEVRYLEQAYSQLGVALPQQTLRRFDDVKAFHAAVVRNRRIYLEEEIAATRQNLQTRRLERAQLDGEQSRILTELNDGGALEVLTTLQKVLAQEEARFGALEHRLAAAEAVEDSSQEIESARVELTREMQVDLDERQEKITEATLLFYDLARALYGKDRSAFLAVEAGKNSLKIVPKINSDASQGINKMAIFCFDLTMAVIAHRGGRGPDFLVHDSHIFDGVDDRQLARALQVAADLTISERMQYIVTINEDDLMKAERLNFQPDGHIIEPRLTDSSTDGGLFGFRFDN
jgi:uncharacterized protein YydD (DUF2326 family)